MSLAATHCCEVSQLVGFTAAGGVCHDLSLSKEGWSASQKKNKGGGKTPRPSKRHAVSAGTRPLEVKKSRLEKL